VIYDVIIIGAGAAGLMCATTAAKRGKKTLILDHAKRPGKKILISGGGRCNFTNYYIEPEKFICENPHFCKSALSQYTQWDFIALVEQYKIAYHEKTLGQLFCDDSAKDILNMLLSECENEGVTSEYQIDVLSTEKIEPDLFKIETNKGVFNCKSLVIATGGLSMPKLGATSFAFKTAENFGLNVLPTRAGLVPFTLPPELKTPLSDVSGVSLPISVSSGGMSFNEDLLVTHRGLSGPAILQISSYWEPGSDISINLLPNANFNEVLSEAIINNPNQTLLVFLSTLFARRFSEKLISILNFENIPINQLSKVKRAGIESNITNWLIKPSGTEGYRTAEITLGGVDTDQLSSKTMEVKSIKGLFFIGECIDVNGWLGGYNFQWAWSSGWVAGQNV